jgi:hypothetical protein
MYERPSGLMPTDDERDTIRRRYHIAEAADAEGLAGVRFYDIVQQVQDAMWQPEYRRIEASCTSPTRLPHD